jgi:FkbM family methyltransferase
MLTPIQKEKLRHWLWRFGLAPHNREWHSFSSHRRNYPEVDASKAVILDVGANVGQTAWKFKASFPDAVVHCFEPFPEIFEVLSANAARMKQVYCHRFAIGAAVETRTVQYDGTSGCEKNSIASKPEGRPGGATASIRIMTLDRFCEDEGLSGIDILKTDTEGFDLDVLKGAEGLIRRGLVRNILTECSLHEGDREHSSFQEISEWLGTRGFEFHAIYEPVHHPEDGRLYFCNALFKARQE